MKTSDLFGQDGKELSPQILTRGFAGEQVMVTYLVLEAGAIGARHAHPHEQVSIVLHGEVEFTLGEERKTLSAGEVIAIPGNVEHGVVAQTKTEMLDIFTPLRTDLLEKLGLAD